MRCLGDEVVKELEVVEDIAEGRSYFFAGYSRPPVSFGNIPHDNPPFLSRFRRGTEIKINEVIK